MKSWNPSPDQLAQTAHCFLAATLVFGVPYLFNCNPLWGGLAVVCWAVPKDLIVDMLVENTTLRAELRDVAAGVALAVCWAFGKFD